MASHIFQVLPSFSEIYLHIRRIYHSCVFVANRASFCSHLSYLLDNFALFAFIDSLILYNGPHLLLLLMKRPVCFMRISFCQFGAKCSHHFLREKYRAFEKLVTSVRNSTMSLTSSIPSAQSNLFVSLSVCMRSTVMSLLQAVAGIIGASVSSVIVSCFATQTVTCSHFQDYMPCVSVCFIIGTGFCLCPKLVLVRNV